MTSCRTCAAIWSDGDVTADCKECGGGAMYRPCPMCNGACGTDWARAVLDTQDSGTAHWIGKCATAGEGAPQCEFRVTWWLDEPALPDLLWAALVCRSTEATVVYSDGTMATFAIQDEAETSLREDECDVSYVLRSQGDVSAFQMPPRTLRDRVQGLIANQCL